MTSPQTTQSQVKTATRTLDVLEYVVARRTGVAAQEIAAALAIPVSSLSYLLATLVERRYLDRTGRTYVPGAGMDRLRQGPMISLAERARPLVRALRQKVNETASLFELSGWEIVAVVTETAEQTLRYSIEPGARAPLHCMAAGKALLATMPDNQLEAYLSEADRPRYTPSTLYEPKDLLRELAAVRARGLAYARDEYSIGVSAIGTAIRSGTRIVAALSVGVPSPRFNPETEARIAEHLAGAREAIEKLTDQTGAS